MPYDLTAGFVPETFDEIVGFYRAAARSSLGAVVDLGPESPLGQFIGLLSIRDQELQERLLAVANGLSRQRAVGYQLDDLYSLLGIGRLEATRSTVTATISGAPLTPLTPGQRAATGAGAQFRFTADTVIGSGGTVDAQMESVNLGVIEAAPGTLTRIIDPIAGWDEITNANAATPGRTRESTPEFRIRGGRETDRNAAGTRLSISAALYRAGASGVVVRVNSTGANTTIRGSTILAHGVLAIAAGGDSTDIANAIVRSVPAGIATGMGSVTIVTEFGDVQFSRPTDVAISVGIEVAVSNTLFPGDGAANIRASVIAYVHGIPIGQHLDINQIIFSVYNSLPAGAAVVASTPTAIKSMGGDDVSDPANVDLIERLRVSANSITVSPV